MIHMIVAADQFVRHMNVTIELQFYDAIASYRLFAFLNDGLIYIKRPLVWQLSTID